MSERRRNPSISMPQLVGAAALALAIFIAVVLTQRLTTSVVLWRQQQQLQAEIDASKAETERLEKKKQRVQTDEWVESVARSDLKMVRPGEVSVIGVPAPSAQSTAVPREWWEQVVGR